MKPNIVLDLCGANGNWSEPYRNNGFDVRIITLPDFDILYTQFFKDYMIFRQLKHHNKTCLIIHYVDVFGILAAPVCTHFSFARTRAKTPRDFRHAMKLVIGCLQIIWECRYRGTPAFWCLENPCGYLRQFLGKPVFTFHPCDFGDPWTKKTDLWGYFNIPKKNNILKPRFTNHFKSGNRMSSFHYLTSLKSHQEGKRLRAITPPGFAKAFFDANHKEL